MSIDYEQVKQEIRYLRDSWYRRIGSYQEGNHKGLNEERAIARWNKYRGLLEWLESGKFLKRITCDVIHKDYARIKREEGDR